MVSVYRNKAIGFRRASRWVGYCGVLAALITAGLWYLLQIVIGEKKLEEFTRFVFFKKISIPAFLVIVAAAALAVILVAILLRILASVNEKRAIRAYLSAKKRRREETLETGLDHIEKASMFAQVFGVFFRKHAVVLVPGILVVLTLGLLLARKKKAPATAQR